MTTPLIFLIQCIFVVRIGRRASRAGASAALVLVALYRGLGLLVTDLALGGSFETPTFLALFPGFFLPFAAVGVGLLPLLIPRLRTGLRDIAHKTPAHEFVGIQILRVLALGTLFKTLTGQFPHHVEMAIGINDLLFGVSAVYLYRRAKEGRLHSDGLVIWHWVGFLLVAAPGEIATQAGLPGPLQVFDQAPTSEVILEWPLVLAPGLVVPIFLLLNLLGAYSARLQRAASGERCPRA
ncbi:MAG: hypothetical protein AAGM22_20185 [Acidobacteriota bacterium]